MTFLRILILFLLIAGCTTPSQDAPINVAPVGVGENTSASAHPITAEGRTTVGVGSPPAGPVPFTFTSFGNEFAGIEIKEPNDYAFTAKWNSVIPARWRLDFQPPVGDLISFTAEPMTSELSGTVALEEPGTWIVAMSPEGGTANSSWTVTLEVVPSD